MADTEQKLDPSIQRAFEKMAQDTDLRTFLRSLFHITGEGSTPFNADPIQMAFLNGRHSVGSDLRRNMDMYWPDLYHELIKEGLQGAKQQKETENVY